MESFKVIEIVVVSLWAGWTLRAKIQKRAGWGSPPYGTITRQFEAAAYARGNARIYGRDKSPLNESRGIRGFRQIIYDVIDGRPQVIYGHETSSMGDHFPFQGSFFRGRLRIWPRVENNASHVAPR